ncbi:putative proline-specific permease put4 [Leucoagaricus sp. SymC.cos]|nr:putative proline-specific permease put4 [Leucoagaricus sp. SymC.cos]
MYILRHGLLLNIGPLKHIRIASPTDQSVKIRFGVTLINLRRRGTTHGMRLFLDQSYHVEPLAFVAMSDEKRSPSPSNYHDASLEKSESGKAHIVVDDEQHHFDAHDFDRVQRRLKQRHIQMIAIAGTIGTGLFLGSGGALATAGPLGALIAYILVGTVAYATLCSIGEMSTWAPISGTFPHFAARWVDPALGFAVGWNYFYGNAITIPTEISAATVLLTFWDLNVRFIRTFAFLTNHAAIYIAVIWVVIVTINIFGVRWFGEAEFIFAIIKLGKELISLTLVSLIIALLLSGLVIDLGGGPNHGRIGFRYWKHPGALNRASLVSNINTDRFLAWLSVLVQASFSFQGMEVVAIAASETENPRRNITKAVRRVFWRILIFYVLGILMIGMLVAYDDPALLQSSGTAAQSPFVIAVNRAGVKVFPHIINACIFSSAFSAGNTFLFTASRVVYGLSLRGQAPKFLSYCTKHGLPIFAVAFTSVFGLLAFMTVSSGAETVFNWFVGLTTTSNFFGWFCINLTYVRFRSGMLAQRINLKSNAYHNSFQPWISYWGMFWTGLFILVNGFAVFFEWNTRDFLIAYINIPIFFGLYLLYKIPKRSKFWKASEMDFYTGIPTLEETETYRDEDEPRTFLEKVADFVF